MYSSCANVIYSLEPSSILLTFRCSLNILDSSSSEQDAYEAGGATLSKRLSKHRNLAGAEENNYMSAKYFSGTSKVPTDLHDMLFRFWIALPPRLAIANPDGHFGNRQI